MLTEFFQNPQLFTQCISMLYTEKSVLRYYVRFSQIRSQLICTRTTNRQVAKRPLTLVTLVMVSTTSVEVVHLSILPVNL